MIKKIRDTVRAARDSIKIAVSHYRLKLQMIWGRRPMVFPQATEESFKEFIDTSMTSVIDLFEAAFKPPTEPTAEE